MDFSRELFKEGVMATGIAFPTVPEGKARIRTIMTQRAHAAADGSGAGDFGARGEADGDPWLSYRCGLAPGDQLRLKKDLVVRDHLNRPNGKVHSAGEVWAVTADACENSAGDLWLRQSDGELHTWSDDDSVFEFFERIGAKG